MSTPWPDLATLELLVATGRTGSLSAAARELGLAQPNASRSISRLERRLGMLAPVMAVLAWQVRRRMPADTQMERPPIVPLFVVGFLAMMGVASMHLLSKPVLADLKLVQTALLAAAMFALGLGVRLRTLVRVGPLPFVLGLASTVLVSCVSLAGVLATSWR